MIRKVAALCVLVLCLPLLSCGDSRASRRAIFYEYFDTVCVISGENMTSAAFTDVEETSRAFLEETHRLFDVYHEYAGVTNLASVNRRAGQEAVTVDPLLMELLLFARDVCSVTEGKVNAAMGAVLRLWHDAMSAASEDPSQAYVPAGDRLREAQIHTDMTQLLLDPEEGTVRFLDPDMKLDVGALAKGWVAERLAERLKEKGYTGLSLNLGGNIRLIGQKKKDNWRIGVQSHESETDTLTVLSLSDRSVVTSGSYIRYFICDGVRYHHIIDPDTLYPARGYVSVTVITEDSGWADAFSTALFCMEPEEGKRWAESLGTLEVMWVKEDGEIVKTDGFSAYESEEDRT